MRWPTGCTAPWCVPTSHSDIREQFSDSVSSTGLGRSTSRNEPVADYGRLPFPDVLAAHAGSIRVKHTLKPLGVAMAGRDVHDPYKD